ncbi:MAG: glutaredoxin family protein [Gammaproteobacteria bacterium]|nr:glutaredoxin family protein [Gammaproteobacteria bacterium]
MTTPVLYFLTTPACHLCDQAEQVLLHTTLDEAVEVEVIDIADDDALVARYGTRIPVLRRADSGAELDWPFTAESVAQWWVEERALLDALRAESAPDDLVP